MSNFAYDRDQLRAIIESLDETGDNQEVNNQGGIHKICQGLNTDISNGISDEEKKDGYKERIAVYGDNRIPQAAKKSLLKIFMDSFKDTMLIILMVMAIISIILQVGVPLVKEIQNPGHEVERGEFPWYFGWIEGSAILIAVVIVSLVTTINDWQKEKRFRELLEQGKKINIELVRGGEVVEIMIDDIYPGDIVKLKTGDKVPADGILIRGTQLKTDESSVTGETKMIKKDENEHPLMKSGTEVCEGDGTMIVIAVGPYSIWGKTMLDVTGGDKLQKGGAKDGKKGEEKKSEDLDDDETPLQKKLDALAKKISYFAFLVAFLALGVLIAGLAIKKYTLGTYTLKFTKDEKCFDHDWVVTASPEELDSVANCGSIGADLTKIVAFAIFAVTIVVAAVPEGLPLAVTISLAYSVKQMLKDQCLVRKLKSCETMGGAQTICSDKTGTLTLNEMNVVKTYIGDKKYFKKMPKKEDLDEKLIELITEGISVNSLATIKRVPKESKDYNPRKPFVVIGNRTEGALLKFVESDLETGYKAIRDFYTSANNPKVVTGFPFSSDLKRMGCVVDRTPPEEEEEDYKQYRLYCKGASEIVLQFCEYYMNEDGERIPMGEDKKEEIIDMIEELAGKGLRTLSLGFKDLSYEEREEGPQNWKQEEIEEGMCLYQIVGIKDPLRKEVIKAVQDCKDAGIIVRMVTGDNIITATHIAKECGIIYDDEHVCMEGGEFRNMEKEDVKKMVHNLRVMARSKPEDKKKLVGILVEMGDCVAVTGDGTNDAPALKKADVGLAMGLTGTEVAKAASDIVILDDNFASIVKAVLWGRTIYDNIRKFLQFQLSVNVVACTLSVLCSLTQFVTITDGSGHPMESTVPFTAVQLLWVNLIMDTLAALALATEKPCPGVLKRKPYGKGDSFINWKMWASIFVQSAYQLIVLIFIHYAGIFIPIFQQISYGEFKTIEWNGIFGGLTNPVWIEENRIYRPWVKNTMVFNTFVFLQVFNEFNCRRINSEWNIFENLHKNMMFVIIFFAIFIMQIVIVEAGIWEPLHLVVSTTGLEWYQWLICIGLGASCILVHFVKNGCFIIIETLFMKKEVMENGHHHHHDHEHGDHHHHHHHDHSTEEEEEEDTSSGTENDSESFNSTGDESTSNAVQSTNDESFKSEDTTSDGISEEELKKIEDSLEED